jgi:rhamnulokinase
VHHLTGATVGEFTSAGTTALLDVHRLTWSVELLDAIGVPAALLPSLQPATTVVGTWRGVPVHLVGGHDTASAVAAMPGPPAPGAAFVSSGTWMLVGTEIDEPDVSAGAQAHNFSNELGVDGRVRFLKNVMGLWMLERCLASWDGGAGDLRGVLDAAANVPAGGPTVDATNERFLAPPDMDAEVRAAASLPSAAPRAVVARCVLDSLALATANVVDEIESVAGELVSEIHILGGGVRNELLVRLIGEATGRRLITGEAEATAVGNALVQGVAFGRFDDLADARRWLGVGRRGEV